MTPPLVGLSFYVTINFGVYIFKNKLLFAYFIEGFNLLNTLPSSSLEATFFHPICLLLMFLNVYR